MVYGDVFDTALAGKDSQSQQTEFLGAGHCSGLLMDFQFSVDLFFVVLGGAYCNE